jgi:hypothetical protein
MENVTSYLKTLSSDVDLGHQKRNQAFLRQVAAYCNSDLQFKHSGNVSPAAAAMSSYRFTRNEGITLDQLREIRLKNIQRSNLPDETLLVINDVSIIDYYKHKSKLDRRTVGDGKGNGYEYVCNLAVSLERECVIGVVHDCLTSKLGPDDSTCVDYHADVIFNTLSATDPERLECNHKHQYLCHFRYIQNQMPGRRLISVGDREFDDQYFFEQCISEQQDFVIRSNSLRNVQIKPYEWLPSHTYTSHYQGLPCNEGYVCADMRNIVAHIPLRTYKSIPLDGKGRHTDEHSAKQWADVSYGSCQVKLYRQFKRNKTYFSPSDYVDVNIVVVKELEPPSGRDPISWILFTSLPISNDSDISKIIRIYELRWLIECFFKLIKSGYKIEDLRVDNAEKVAKHLVLMSIAAVFMLNIKQTLRFTNGSKLDDEAYTALRDANKNINDESISIEIRIFARIAFLGGWLGRRADPISTLMLMKGWKTFMAMIDLLTDSSSFLKEANMFLNK